jgi:NADH:ubiquinone oxidoreductase subunit F (NADH-binding)
MEATITPATIPAPNINVGYSPRCAPRLIDVAPDAEQLDRYTAGGGYGAVPDPVALLDVVDESGLLGRGGAAFPLAVKLRGVRDRGRRGGSSPVLSTAVVANGEEGEPASVKDRWLLRHRPHLILDGLRLAARIVAADRGYVYVSDRAGARAVADALADLRGADLLGPDLEIEVVTVAPGYVAGEETAAVRVINGGPAKPTDKPPRPFESGVAGRPTLVSNVETLANLPFLHRHGSSEFRSVGTSASPGTFLATVSGAGRTPGLYEVPHGLPFVDLLSLHGVSPDDVHGVLMGGYYAGLLNRRVLDETLDHETLRRLDSGLGCGAVAVLTRAECPVAVAASVLKYFDRENAGQCGSCFNGTAAMSAVAEALRDGAAEQSDVDRLTRWSVVLRGRGACATLDGAANVAASLLREFPEFVERHLGARCDTCTATPFSAERPFAIEPAAVS